MKLKEYIVKYRVDPMVLAVKVGISLRSIYRYMDGCAPHFKIACKLEEATDKLVTVEDLRGKDDEQR